jgi:hypothetical protein
MRIYLSFRHENEDSAEPTTDLGPVPTPAGNGAGPPGEAGAAAAAG